MGRKNKDAAGSKSGNAATGEPTETNQKPEKEQPEKEPTPVESGEGWGVPFNPFALLLFLTCVSILAISALHYYWEWGTLAKCETCTSDWESYYQIELSPEVESKFPDYKLYLVGELYTEEVYKTKNFSFGKKERLSGVPILFIPGNAGFHEQGRTASSIMTNMGKNRGTKNMFIFDFFTVDFNEELLAFSGHYLYRTKEFTDHCVRRIASLYEDDRKVLLIGHSVGGVVARSLDTFGSLSNTLITVAAPHLMPVVLTDPKMENFYATQLKSPSPSRFIMSFAAGPRDVVVPTHLSLIPSGREEWVLASYPCVGKAHVTATHVESMWCRSAVIVLCRVIHDLVDRDTRVLLEDSRRKREVALFHTHANPGAKSIHDPREVDVDSVDFECASVDLKTFRSFTYLSQGAKHNFLLAKLKDGSLVDLGSRKFNVLPPFKSNHDAKLYLQHGNKYAHITQEDVLEEGIREFCVPSEDSGGDFDYSFDAHSFLPLVNVNFDTINIGVDVMHTRLELDGLNMSYHMTRVRTRSTCLKQPAFLVMNSAQGRQPFLIPHGNSTVTITTWLPFTEGFLEVVKPSSCTVQLKFAQHLAGYAHFVRSHVTSLPTYLVMIALMYVMETMAGSQLALSSTGRVWLALSSGFLLKIVVFALVLAQLTKNESYLPDNVATDDLKLSTGLGLLYYYDAAFLVIFCWSFFLLLLAAFELVKTLLGLTIKALLGDLSPKAFYLGKIQVVMALGIFTWSPSVASVYLNCVILLDVLFLASSSGVDLGRLAIHTNGLFISLLTSSPCYLFLIAFIRDSRDSSFFLNDSCQFQSVATMAVYLAHLLVENRISQFPAFLKGKKLSDVMLGCLYTGVIVIFTGFLLRAYLVMLLATFLYIVSLVIAYAAYYC